MHSKAFLNLENCRIRFNTREGEYEGIVSRFVPETEVLFVKNVIWVPKSIKMGTLTFRAHEISAFEIIGQLQASKPNPHIYAQKYYRDSKHYTLLDDEFDDNSSMHESEIYDDEEKQYELKLPPMLSDILPLDNVVIDCRNEEFYESLCHIKKQDVIGLSLESPKINRFEKLHWLCISTQSCTFLFDMKALGKDAVYKGLKDILEDPRIVKVLHDCREICDCMYHQYDTKLMNVFDTQVADYIINQQRKKKGKHTNHVNPLNSCLAYYLDVPEEFLYRRKKRSYQDDLVFFGLRPISDDFRDLFIKNVIYLRRLKQELDHLLLEPLHRCTDVYLKTLLKKTNREFNLEVPRVDTLPDELLSEGVQVFRFREYEHIPDVVSSGPPYRENKSSFKQFFDYCDKIENGDGCFPLQKISSISAESIPNKNNRDNLCNNFASQVVLRASDQDIVPLERESSLDSSSEPTDSLDSDSKQLKLFDKNQTECKVSEDDPWLKLRNAFANTGSTLDELKKYVLIPAGKLIH